MRFEKGHQYSKGKGRPKGKESAIKGEIRQELLKIVKELTKDIINNFDDMKSLSIKDKLVVLDRLVQYVIPKAKELHVSQDSLPAVRNLSLQYYEGESLEKLNQEIIDEIESEIQVIATNEV